MPGQALVSNIGLRLVQLQADRCWRQWPGGRALRRQFGARPLRKRDAVCSPDSRLERRYSGAVFSSKIYPLRRDVGIDAFPWLISPSDHIQSAVLR